MVEQVENLRENDGALLRVDNVVVKRTSLHQQARE